ncbi:MAG: MerR family transcriptional regulator [Halioglobus sp.]
MMAAIELQRRPLYGIGTVARLTGVKPDTLRIWERRYQLGASQKSATGRRLFTQADVEHLQLVAALVSSGTRIGEIAASGRLTLEALLQSRDQRAAAALGERKPRIAFVGTALCDWLQEHQGCLAHVDALLARCSLAQLEPAIFGEVGEVDGLVVELGGLSGRDCALLASLTDALGTRNVLVLHRFANAHRLEELTQQGYTLGDFPPEPAFLASHLSLSAVGMEAQLATENLGKLLPVKPRLFDDTGLSAARGAKGALQCECSNHLADLVSAVAAFEDYSANCSVDNWQDASLHACVYTYAGQARWLLEKALRLVVDAHDDQAAA